MATREALEAQATLPGLETAEVARPFPTMDLTQGRYKVHGVASNMDWAGTR